MSKFYNLGTSVCQDASPGPYSDLEKIYPDSKIEVSQAYGESREWLHALM